MKNILDQNLTLKNKKVLLRVDLNVPMTNGSITESSRIIDRSLRTIVKKEAEIINLPLSKEEKNIELIAKQQ